MSSIEAWVATYPGGHKYLEETLESLRGQVHPVTIHVQDDDRLPHDKWNDAFEKCESDYIALPHHDDIYMPTWSKELSEYLYAHPTVVACFSLDYLIDSNGKRIGQTYPAWQEQDTYSFKDLIGLDAKYGNVFRCETVMFNRKVLGDMRYPDRSISGTAQDTQFWYELAARHPIGIVMKPLVKYRMHPDSDTQRNVYQKPGSSDGYRARLYATTLRPQDVEPMYVVGLTRLIEKNDTISDANRVRERSRAGCEFLVCHEPPDAAGTGVVVAHRVRTLNKHADGKIRYYVYPTGSKEIEVVWSNGVPIVRCPSGAFGDIIDKLKPSKIEYHHLLRWPLDILNAPCPRKELWLHDSYLWCARYHSVKPDGTVCNEPSPKVCAECSGESYDSLIKKAEFLAKTVLSIDRYVANSDYTAKHAKENLGVYCEVVAPTGAALASYPRKKRVGYFGGLGLVKGTPILLQAWRLMKGDAQLLAFCDVPAEWLDGRKLAGFDDVLVMGGYRRDNLPDLCNLVDLAVVPSINESYGLVRRELESLGVKVLATKTGGLEGDIPPGDAVALAEAIRAAL